MYPIQTKQPSMRLVIEHFDSQGNLTNTYEEEQARIESVLPQVEIAEIFPSGGEIVRFKKPMDSYVANFVRLLKSQLEQSSSGMYDTTSASRGSGVAITNFATNAGANISTWGVLVGTGSASVTIDDIKLGGQILHGTGSGQLTHGAVQYDDWQTVGQTTSFVIKRRFTNNDVSDITFYEKGIVVGSAATNHFLIVRELVGVGGYTVSASQTCEVRFTIPITTGSSFVGNFVKCLTGPMEGLGNPPKSITDTTGTSRTNFTTTQATCFSMQSNVAWGLVVGTGSAADGDINDFRMSGLIGNGTGSNQLTYNTIAYDPFILSASTATAGVKRVFFNGSSAAVTITECGWEPGYRDQASNQDTPILMVRTKLSVPQTIQTGSSAQVKYIYGVSI